MKVCRRFWRIREPRKTASVRSRCTRQNACGGLEKLRNGLTFNFPGDRPFRESPRSSAAVFCRRSLAALILDEIEIARMRFFREARSGSFRLGFKRRWGRVPIARANHEQHREDRRRHQKRSDEAAKRHAPKVAGCALVRNLAGPPDQC